MPTFADRGVSRGQRGEFRAVVNLSFLDRSRYFSFKYLLICPHKGWVDPVPELLLLRKSGSVGNRTRNLWVWSQEDWPLDHRGGQLSVHTSVISHTYENIYTYMRRMPTSGFLCHVILVRTHVSEEHIASIIRVTRIGDLGTLAVTSSRSKLWRYAYISSQGASVASCC
jgi:hypothetical protein